MTNPVKDGTPVSQHCLRSGLAGAGTHLKFYRKEVRLGRRLETCAAGAAILRKRKSSNRANQAICLN